MRKAKLICTLGPATATPRAVRALVDAGMDVARINFSHGTHDEHASALERVRAASGEAGRTVAALADLSGPKVRLGELSHHLHLEPGMRFVLRPDGPPGDETGASTSHPGLGHDLRPGDRVLIADGVVELVVMEAGDEVVTEVVKALRKARVAPHAGVNVPSERLSMPAVTEKDRADLAAVLDMGFDLVAQSFVRSAADVQALRTLMGDRRVPIVAKIENRPAVEAAEDVAAAADAVMVARGDLGVEIPLEEIPVTQKELIRVCRRAGTPSIVATQMMESMLGSASPTRAEVSDAANAVLDGADAVMLSGETAIGAYPAEAAEAAATVVRVAEERGAPFRAPAPVSTVDDDGRAVAQAACAIARTGLEVSAIACFTRTGYTARALAAARPDQPIIAFSSEPSTVRTLALTWGVQPFLSDAPSDVDELIAMMDRRLVGDGLCGRGRTVVMVAAAPVGHAHTNLLKVHHLGDPAYRP
ncbi:MAG TPA: pyruvate kinase [Actinomycetota bacterium]